MKLQAICWELPLRTSWCLAAILLLAIASGCSSGSGAGPEAPTEAPPGETAATINLLVRDAQSPALSMLEVWFTDIRLADAEQGETDNLVLEPRGVNFFDYLGRSELLQVRGIGPGAYAGARLSIDELAVQARDATGNAVPIRVEAATASFALAEAVQLSTGQTENVSIEIDLDRALLPDPNWPGGFVLRLDGGGVQNPVVDDSPELVDEVHGRVLSAAAAARTLVIELTRLEDGAGIGELSVVVADATVLLGDNAQVLTEDEFFVLAIPGADVDADGSITADGALAATRIQVETMMTPSAARVGGHIVSIDSALGTMRLRVLEVLEGAAVVDPVLTALGNPPEIDVSTASAQVRLQSGPGTLADLQIGQFVRVRFASFVDQPFPANEIEIEVAIPEFEGRVHAVDELPARFVVRLEPHDPAVISGRVASAATDVAVELDGTERLWLQLPHEPDVNVTDIAVGLRVRLIGSISGDPVAPTITADDVRVRPGRLDATVVAASAVDGSFTLGSVEIDQTFGVLGLGDPLVAHFASLALVEDDASSVDAFFALWSGLSSGAAIEVRLFGLADGAGGVIAHRLEVELDD